mgnify:CR=1 FL=1
MSTAVKIVVGKTILSGELFDTLCAQAIIKSLPIKARSNVWGDEIYFEIPVDIPLDESATRKVKVGDIAYWPPGKALAIFFGTTPMSTSSDPVPAGEVNIVGRIIGDATSLKKEKDAGKIIIESA